MPAPSDPAPLDPDLSDPDLSDPDLSDAGGQGPAVTTQRRAPRRRLRRVLAALVMVAALTVAALAAVSWHFSNVATEVSHVVTLDTVATPAGPGRVRLPREHYEMLPGRYGLIWDGGYGELGPVLADDERTVVRSLTPTAGSLALPLPARIDLYAFDGDPRTARGLDFSEVSVPGELGGLPAWYVPAVRTGIGDAGRTWVVFVHGRGGDRREALRYLPVWHVAGLPVLVATHRNDLGAPAAPDGRNHLGESEWRDVEAAVRYALDAGARDVVLAGESQGGALVLQTLDRSELRDRVRGLVLDSPVLDWWDVFVHQGGEMGLPAPLSRLAGWTLERRIGIDLDRYDWVRRAEELRRPGAAVRLRRRHLRAQRAGPAPGPGAARPGHPGEHSGRRPRPQLERRPRGLRAAGALVAH